MAPTVWNNSFLPEARVREGGSFFFMVLVGRLKGLIELKPPVVLSGLPSCGEVMVVAAPIRARDGFIPTLMGEAVWKFVGVNPV